MLKDLIPYLALRGLETSLRALGWERAQAAGAALGAAAGRVLTKKHRVALDNLERALPEMPAARREAVARRVWREFGMMFGEMVCTRGIDDAEALERMPIENWEHVAPFLKEGRGGIFHAGHLGNWESMVRSLQARGVPFGAIGRSIKNPYVDAWLTDLRAEFGAQVISHRRPFFTTMKFIKDGGWTAILSDHNIAGIDTFIEFFGRPAATTTMVALIAAKSGCPIVPFQVIRDGAKIRGRLHPPVFVPAKANEHDILAATQRLNAMYEDWIREHPAQWLWIHNRWKREHEAPAKV